MVPKLIQEAKELWLKGDESSKKKAKKITLPFVKAYCLPVNTGYSSEELNDILGDFDELWDAELFGTFYISYKKDTSAPYVGGSTKFFVPSSKDLATEDLTEEQVSNLTGLVSFEFNSEEIETTHPDRLSIYFGERYFGIQPFSNKAH